MSAPSVPTPLKYLSLLRLFIDASDMATMNFLKATQFNLAQSQYLQAAHSASLDFSTGTNANTFSIEIWRNTTLSGTSRCYVSKDIFNTSGKRGWAARASGTAGHESQVEFWSWNSSASAYGAIVTTNAPSNWSHCVIAVDMTVPTVSLYFDGSTTPATTTALQGTLGILPTGQTAPLLLGAWNFGTSGGVTNFYDGAMASIRLWRQALAPGFVPALFNGGFPAPYAYLGGAQKTNLVAAWDLTEASGMRFDSTANANHLSEQNGPLGQATLCRSLFERGPRGYQFHALRFNYAPPWIAQSPINNAPALRMCGQHWMRASAPGFCNDCRAGDILTVLRPTDLSLANFDYAILTADKESYDGNFTYLFPMFYNAALQTRIRRNAATTINGQISGTATYNSGSTYVTNQRGFGAGGAASFAYRVNGVANPIDLTYGNFGTDGTNTQNQWYASLEGVDSLILGGLDYDPGMAIEGPYSIQARFAGYLSTVLIYGATTANGSLSDSQNLAVENWARQLANV
jgi:hypothetical protein